MTYYLVDTENVSRSWHPFAMEADPGDIFILFYSRNVGPVSLNLLGSASMRGVKFDFIECCTGANAMDFQLVTMLGNLVAQHPGDRFVILSRDTGYDSVVKFWRARSISVERMAPETNPAAKEVKAGDSQAQDPRYSEMLAMLAGTALPVSERSAVAEIVCSAMRNPKPRATGEKLFKQTAVRSGIISAR